MIKADFVIPDTWLQTVIQMQVVVGQRFRNPHKDFIHKSQLCEITIPDELRQLPSSHDNPNILEIFIVKGFSNKS
ncbi:MAG: hypothetical protein ACYDH1_17625 [Anaerolineaceae bacterium]